MKKEKYVGLHPTWPQSGRHILASFSDSSIVVYQAYRPAIARFAVEHQQFGGEFSFSRMSWIKPNFLWMMYRSGWAGKEGQEHILAVTLPRRFFDEILLAAVPSTYLPSQYATYDDWQNDLKVSEVRLQWDPDHDPDGRPLDRRAVQLGLRGDALRRYATQEVISIEDITDFVVEQSNNRSHADSLIVPSERMYLPRSDAGRRIGIDSVYEQHA